MDPGRNLSRIPDPDPGVKKTPNPRSGSRNSDYGLEEWYTLRRLAKGTRFPRVPTWQHCRRLRGPGGHSPVSCRAPSLPRAERSWCRSALLYCTETEGTQMNAKERYCRAGRFSCGSGCDVNFDADSDSVCSGIVFSKKKYKIYFYSALKNSAL